MSGDRTNPVAWPTGGSTADSVLRLMSRSVGRSSYGDEQVS